MVTAWAVKPMSRGQKKKGPERAEDPVRQNTRAALRKTIREMNEIFGGREAQRQQTEKEAEGDMERDGK